MRKGFALDLYAVSLVSYQRFESCKSYESYEIRKGFALDFRASAMRIRQRVSAGDDHGNRSLIDLFGFFFAAQASVSL